MDHADFRAWCPHCVMGRAVSYGHHTKAEDNQDRVPLVRADYMYMRENRKNREGDKDEEEEEEEKGMPTLVVKDTKNKMMTARVVPRKGVDPYAVTMFAKEFAMFWPQKR